MTSNKKIFIIAGEESGDALGAKLINAIRHKNPDIDFIGVGGMKMAYTGFKTIFPMQEISLMGFAEIVPHLPKLITRINETVEAIIAERPDILVTIDSPGFNYRVARKLKAKNVNIKKIHFVAPSVWAYKEHRAKTTAKLFDHLLTILPWEPPYFEKEGMKADFVGHPIFEDLNFMDSDQRDAFRKDYNYSETDKVIAILPGSRRGEVRKLLPTFIQAAQKIYEQNKNAKFILMPTETMRAEVIKFDHKIPNCITISDTEEKRRLLQICNAAIVKSGTVALEVAALGCPNIICYKISPISHWMIRRMLYIEYANLINISARKEIIKELIQDDCTADNISKEILKLINSEVTAKSQIEEARYELNEMGLGAEEHPSAKAAAIVTGYLNN